MVLEVVMYGKGELTAIDIAHNDLSTFIREQSGCFGSNALSRASDDGCLAVEHALGVVQMARDLLSTSVRHGCGG
jgi:hypothetical protein